MVFCFVVALLATFTYLNLILSDAINLRLNPAMGVSRDKDQAILVSKIKYVLILIMAITWGIIMSN